jgi:hypothetical protein
MSSSKYDHLKVDELKGLLRARGLALTGLKADLKQRLIDHDNKQGTGGQPSHSLFLPSIAGAGAGAGAGGLVSAMARVQIAKPAAPVAAKPAGTGAGLVGGTPMNVDYKAPQMVCLCVVAIC